MEWCVAIYNMLLVTLQNMLSRQKNWRNNWCVTSVIELKDNNFVTREMFSSVQLCWFIYSFFTAFFFLSISPSGCTFWGKKPWSRKKKILWQLGTLVGAPVGIALIAGIAIPAMIIGIPVYVGRKVKNASTPNKLQALLSVVWFGWVQLGMLIGLSKQNNSQKTISTNPCFV